MFQVHRHIFQQLSNFSQAHVTRKNKRILKYFFQKQTHFPSKNVGTVLIIKTQKGQRKCRNSAKNLC